jgi:hypothetical protein
LSKASSLIDKRVKEEEEKKGIAANGVNGLDVCAVRVLPTSHTNKCDRV